MSDPNDQRGPWDPPADEQRTESAAPGSAAPPTWSPSEPPSEPGAPPSGGQQSSAQQYGAPQYGAPPSSGQQYGGQQYGGYPPGVPGAQIAPSASTVLTMGIVSVVLLIVCGFLAFIPALIALAKAGSAQREIDSSGGRLGGQDKIRTGKILAWVTLGISALAVVAIAVLIAVGVAVGDGSSSPSDDNVVGLAVITS